MNFSMLPLPRKQQWKQLLTALNNAGYFVNVPENKCMIHVMSHNEQHDTLIGVWTVINDIELRDVKVEREPDDKVIGIVFNN